MAKYKILVDEDGWLESYNQYSGSKLENGDIVDEKTMSSIDYFNHAVACGPAIPTEKVETDD